MTQQHEQGTDQAQAVKAQEQADDCIAEPIATASDSDEGNEAQTLLTKTSTVRVCRM